MLQKDLDYWGIDPFLLEACCALKYFPQLETCQSEKDEDLAAKRAVIQLADEEDFGSSSLARWRGTVWRTLGRQKDKSS